MKNVYKNNGNWLKNYTESASNETLKNDEERREKFLIWLDNQRLQNQQEFMDIFTIFKSDNKEDKQNKILFKDFSKKYYDTVCKKELD